MAWAFAFIAGTVNVIGLLGFEHQAVTHLTGNTTLLAAAIASPDLGLVSHFGALIGSFVVGAAISGFVVRDNPLQLGRRHGAALAIVSLLLFASFPLLQGRSAYGMYAAACAIGLQNAMISTYTGSIVRTSHVSGMFTDLGMFVGHAVRGLPVDRRRVRVSLTVICGFLVGGLVGAGAFRALSYSAVLLPAGLAGAASLVSLALVTGVAEPGS